MPRRQASDQSTVLTYAKVRERIGDTRSYLLLGNGFSMLVTRYLNIAAFMNRLFRLDLVEEHSCYLTGSAQTTLRV